MRKCRSSVKAMERLGGEFRRGCNAGVIGPANRVRAPGALVKIIRGVSQWGGQVRGPQRVRTAPGGAPRWPMGGGAGAALRRERLGWAHPRFGRGNAVNPRGEPPGGRRPGDGTRGNRDNRPASRPGISGVISPDGTGTGTLTPAVASAMGRGDGGGGRDAGAERGHRGTAPRGGAASRARRRSHEWGAAGWGRGPSQSKGEPGMWAATWCVESRACAFSLSVPVPASTPSSIP